MKENVKQALLSLKETSDIFNELTDQEIDMISPFFEQKSYSAESFLFREGEPSTFIGFIASGTFEIIKQTDIQANPIILGRLSTGSFIGETTLLEGPQKRAVSVYAV
ncbi:MAG: cyclic nucleotide-binding domain-containing protein [Nitrospiraceae bacterium]|nr:MAG: cyclic nucleotide-binding domain-containing protein [Nitrospiraceae bacterium]